MSIEEDWPQNTASLWMARYPSPFSSVSWFISGVGIDRRLSNMGVNYVQSLIIIPNGDGNIHKMKMKMKTTMTKILIARPWRTTPGHILK